MNQQHLGIRGRTAVNICLGDTPGGHVRRQVRIEREQPSERGGEVGVPTSQTKATERTEYYRTTGTGPTIRNRLLHIGRVGTFLKSLKGAVNLFDFLAKTLPEHF